MLTLTPDELRQLTAKRRSDAQRRVLDAMGIRYMVRPDGSLAVLRVLVMPSRAYTMPEPEVQP